MPPQASAAGHRVAARVRWVAMITTMHPASVAHPHAIGVPLLLLAHRGTPFTWTEACHPDQQATRPFAAPYAARAGPLDPYGCIPGLAELQVGQRGREDRDGNAADRSGDGLVEPLFSVPEEAPHAISRVIKGR